MTRTTPTVAGPSLVGRAREIGALRDRLDRATTTGRGTAVLVTGEAGVGKSRLVRELAADAVARGWEVVEGRCVAVGAEPLRRVALLEILRSSTAPVGGGGPGLTAASTEELLEQVLALVDGATPDAPRLVLVEDVHWADRATCEVLMVLARHVAGRPACLVVTSRDDELPRGHQVRGFLAELRRAGLVATVALTRLGAAEVATLIQHLVGPVEPARASAVFERSGGNPLLVEELCAAGRSPAGGDLGDPGDLGDLDDRLVDVLLARTDGLSPAALGVARAVAAAGRFVDEALLAEVVGATGADDADGFAAALREALDHHLLVRRGDDVGFRHVLVAEAVHGQMLVSERAGLHARWADVLCHHDVDPAVLAHHWVEARDPELALAASVAAGDAAVLGLAPLDAIAHHRRALALWPDVADPVAAAGRSRVDLCAGAAEAANWAGRPDEAVELVTLALEGHGDGTPLDPVATCRLRERHGWYLLRQGRTDEARAPYRAAVEGLPDDAPAGDRARVLGGSVRIWERLRDPERALTTARAAVAAAVDATDADEGQARYMLGRALLASGRTDEALAELAFAAASAERCLDAVSLSIALMDRADVLATQGRLDAARVEAGAAAERLRGRGHVDPHALLCVGVAAGLLHRMGRVDDARPLVAGLVAEARTPVTLALGHLLTGLLDLDALALAGAREHLEMARFLSAPLLDGRMAGNLAWGRAELALAEDRLDDAGDAVDEGIAQVTRTGDDRILGELCLLGLRIAADRSARADPRRSPRAKARDAAAITRYERLLAPLAAASTEAEAETGAGREIGSDATAGAVGTAAVAATIGAAWEAERRRRAGAADPRAWAGAAERWAAIGHPRHAVAALIRRAEALQARPGTRPEAPAALEQAVKEAEAIGSRLLAEQARAVARRAGMTTVAGATPTPALGADQTVAGPARTGTPAGLADLTRREREVLDLLAAGSTNRQIADALYISSKTASVHVSRILAKVGVATRQEAAAVARRHHRS